MTMNKAERVMYANAVTLCQSRQRDIHELEQRIKEKDARLHAFIGLDYERLNLKTELEKTQQKLFEQQKTIDALVRAIVKLSGG